MSSQRDDLRIVILDDYQNAALGCADWSGLGPQAEIVVFDRHLIGPDLVASLRSADVICLMRERTPIDADVLRQLDRLKLIVVAGPPLASLDYATVAARGIRVEHTGVASSVEATVELSWGLILAAARNIPREVAGMRAGGWQTTIGSTLHGRRLGVLGLGRIGGGVAQVGRALGMDVVAWSANLTEARAAEVGARLCPRDELLATSDVVTIHLTLSERTRDLLGRSEFALMRPTSLLINTSRGPIVNEAALIEALSGRQIGGAALDVFATEPLPADHPLRALDNVILTPHLGYVTLDTYQSWFGEMVELIGAWRRDGASSA